MKILAAFWQYWKSLSVWFCTAFVVLLILTAIVHVFSKPSATDTRAHDCLEKGGTWDADNNYCKTAA